MIKLWAPLNQVGRKGDCGVTLWKSYFCWRDGYHKFNKDFSQGLQRQKAHWHQKELVTKLLILLHIWGTNCLDHLQQFDRNSWECCLAGWHLQSIHLDSVKQQLRSLLTTKKLQLGWLFVEQPWITPDNFLGTQEKYLYAFLLEEQSDGLTFILMIKCELGWHQRQSLQKLSLIVNTLSLLDRVLNNMNGDSCQWTWLLC